MITKHNLSFPASQVKPFHHAQVKSPPVKLLSGICSSQITAAAATTAATAADEQAYDDSLIN